jgi:glycine betaine/proline transport system permease protein
MAGVNQTIMMALGIVVIAALIGAGGLGREVLIALQRLRVGEGLEAGLAIVFMAIVLDRISHGFAQQDVTHPHRRRQGFNLVSNAWHRFGPARGFEQGLALLLNRRYRPSQALAGGAAELAGQEADLSGQRKFAWAIASWLQRHAYLVSSLLLLALLLVINAFVVAFGEFPEHWDINLSRPVDTGVAWMRDNLYQIGDLPIGTGPLSDFLIIYGLNPLRSFLQKWLPWPLLMLGVALLAYLVAGWRQALFAAAGMLFIGLLGMWEHSLTTLSQVIVAVIVTVVIAIPLGILAARSNMFEAFLRPILDTLQTIPPFVFLVPVIMLFNIGSVPGIIASVLYALPPGIRLTNLGIRQVPAATIEAATAFGSTRRQLLFKVQIPLALPAIMLGVNQIVMMVLAMVIIAGLVGGGGLGLEAVTGLAKNQTGRGIEAGLAIVVMAMIMDRMTQVWARKKQVVGRGH